MEYLFVEGETKMLLKGKNVVITGAGRGIGRHVAIACAKEGANIGITSRTLAELNETKKLIEELGTGVKIVVKTGDIGVYDDVEQIFKTFNAELGPLNGVIANAAYSRRWDTHDFKVEKWQEIIDINLNGVYYTFKASYPFLDKDNKKDRPRFIITSSAAYPGGEARLVAYAASKFGVVGIMKSLAKEYKNITFNAILPTMTDTKLLRGDKAGDGGKDPLVLHPWDFVDEYIFLLSDDANRTSGELIYTQDYQMIRKHIEEAPADKKENWDSFQGYLEENASKLLNTVKKQRKLVEFLLTRIK